MRFAFDEDALDAVSQGTVKTTKMTAEAQPTRAPLMTKKDADAQIDAALARMAVPFAALADPVATPLPDGAKVVFVGDADIARVVASVAGAGGKRVLVVAADAGAVAAQVTVATGSKDKVAVAELGGPQAVGAAVVVTTPTGAIAALAEAKDLSPLAMVALVDASAFTVAQLQLLALLKPLLAPTAETCRLVISGARCVQQELQRYFAPLPMRHLEAKDGLVVSTDALAAAAAARIPTAAPATTSHGRDGVVPAAFAPVAKQALDHFLGRVAKQAQTKGAVVVFAAASTQAALQPLPLPVVASLEAAMFADKAVVFFATSAAEAAGLEPLAVVDLGTTDRAFAPTAHLAAAARPRVEFASVVEAGRRAEIAGNRALLLALPDGHAIHRPFADRTGSFLAAQARHELLIAARAGLRAAEFPVAIPSFTLDQALVTLAELSLTSSKTDTAVTFVGELVSRLPCLPHEWGYFVTMAAALGLPEAGAAVAAAAVAPQLHAAGTVLATRRAHATFDVVSDVLADGVALLKAVSGAASAPTGPGAAAACHHYAAIVKVLAEYCMLGDEGATAVEQDLRTHARTLATIHAAASAATAVRGGKLLFARAGEDVTIREDSLLAATGVAASSIVVGSIAEQGPSGPVALVAGTALSEASFNAALLALRPAVGISPAATGTAFALAAAGTSRHYRCDAPSAEAVVAVRDGIRKALGVMMLKRLLPAAADTDHVVACIRAKSRAFRYGAHVDELRSRIESLAGTVDAVDTITTVAAKQTSVLSPVEVGELPAGTEPRPAADFAAMQAAVLASAIADVTSSAAAPSGSDAATAAAEGMVQAPSATAHDAPLDDNEDDDDAFYRANGPLEDSDDE